MTIEKWSYSVLGLSDSKWSELATFSTITTHLLITFVLELYTEVTNGVHLVSF
jgi:hypothetical protein